MWQTDKVNEIQTLGRRCVRKQRLYTNLAEWKATRGRRREEKRRERRKQRGIETRNSSVGNVYTTFIGQGNYQQYVVLGSCYETPSTSITVARDTKLDWRYNDWQTNSRISTPLEEGVASRRWHARMKRDEWCALRRDEVSFFKDRLDGNVECVEDLATTRLIHCNKGFA